MKCYYLGKFTSHLLFHRIALAVEKYLSRFANRIIVQHMNISYCIAGLVVTIPIAEKFLHRLCCHKSIWITIKR